jgi:hypothetical protein
VVGSASRGGGGWGDDVKIFIPNPTVPVKRDLRETSKLKTSSSFFARNIHVAASTASSLFVATEIEYKAAVDTEAQRLIREE